VTDTAPMSANNHPGPEEIAAYLSNVLPPDARAVVDAHLSQCRSCRRQVTSAQALLRTRPRSMRWLAIPVAAAIVIVLIRPGTRRDDARTPQSELQRARAGSLTTDVALVAVTPADGDTIRGVSPRFTWRSRGPDVLYHLSLTDARGRALWTIDTRDTTVVLSPNVRLEVGTRYFWLVDALSATAVSWTTGTRTFVVSR
jgi:putative zinc finger protein